MNDLSVLIRMDEVCESMVELNKLDELGPNEIALLDELYEELLYLQRELAKMLDIDSVEIVEAV